MTQHTITRHIVRLGDGRKVEVDNARPISAVGLGFYAGERRDTGTTIQYFRHQIEEMQDITVEVDRDGHRVDERPKV